MEKSKINVLRLEPKTFYFGKQAVFVDSYISLEHKYEIIKNYVDSFFKSDDFVDNYLAAEYGLILAVVDLCTNVALWENATDENGNVVEQKVTLDVNDIIGSGLFDKIKESIINYADFRKELSEIVKTIMEQKALEKSFSVSFEKLVDKLSGFLDKISNIDLSETGLKSLIEQLATETKNLDKTLGNEPVASLPPEKPQRKKRVSKSKE